MSCSFATPATGQQVDNPAPASSAPDASMPKIWLCPRALETMLPGEYYGCQAQYDYQHQDYESMVGDLKEAAHWANKNAQYTLGLIYFTGDTPDVPTNRPLGLAWLALATERKDPTFALQYAAARARATPDEINQANVLWRKMHKEYGDEFAAPRAVRYFNHAIQPIDDAASNGGLTYINGYTAYPETAFALSNQLHAQADADFSTWHGTVTVGQAVWSKTTTPKNADSTGQPTSGSQP